MRFIVCNFHFSNISIWFHIRVMLDSEIVRNDFLCFCFLEKIMKNWYCLLNIWQNSPVKLFGYDAFFSGMLLVIDSIDVRFYIIYFFMCEFHSLCLSRNWWGLPWWRSGWESACQCRGHGFEPWSGKIPHATEQLGPWATTTEPERLEPLLRNKRGRDSERPAHRDEEWPPLAVTGESPHTETKTQHSQKIKK